MSVSGKRRAANIQHFPGNAAFAAPTQTFDITSVTAKHVGPYIGCYSFDTDGTMLVLHTQGAAIVGWDDYDGATVLQSATANLASRNPSSTKAMAYFMGGDDLLTGSQARDEMIGGGGRDTLLGGARNDHLVGGAGADRLVGAMGADRLTGSADADHFVHGVDQIDLAAAAFGPTGPLVDGVSFVAGRAATQNPAMVLYDPATGVLCFDAGQARERR